VTMAARGPDAAPHCPKCGYNLYGLLRLRCPECGYVILSLEDLEEARLLAKENEADRKALRADRIRGIVGVVLWVLGTALALLGVVGDRRMMGNFLNFRTLCYGVLGSLALLYFEKKTDEPVNGLLFVIGIVWFAVGVGCWWLSW
jgi:hypothetical protein